MIIQIYEIQTPAEAETMIELDVDHVGSVLVAEERWRNPEIRDTVRQVQAAGKKSSLIPLFRTPDSVSGVLDYYRPDIVHFCESLIHGDGVFGIHHELTELQESVKEQFPEIQIMRSIPIAPPGWSDMVPSLEIAREFEPVSDWFLTDTLLVDQGKTVPHAKQPVFGFVGITGKTCDWNVAKELVRQSRIPVILAGGLSPDNVAEGISRTAPAGVDSCTATNAVNEKGLPVRFQKDAEKVRRFVRNAREAAS